MEIAPESCPVFQCPRDPQYLKKCNHNSPIKLSFWFHYEKRFCPRILFSTSTKIFINGQ